MPSPKGNQGIIRKSNELIEARYRLSLGEQRLVLLLTTEISPNDEDFKEYELKVSQFVEMFDLDADKRIYERVEQAAEQLLGRIIALKDGPEVEKTTWLSYVRYVKGSGTVKIRFDKSLRPYLLQLKGRFTQYNLSHVVNFKSQYSIRLYELLKMDAYKAKKGVIEKTIMLKELREILGIGKKEYSAFDNLRRRVIEPAVREISEQTDIAIAELAYLRTGRKVTGLTFHVQTGLSTKAKILEIEEETLPAPIQHPIVERLINLGFAIETARRYKTKYGIKHLERNIAYALAKQQEGLVKDFPAYLNKAITEDMGGAWVVVKTKQEEEKLVTQAKVNAREKEAELAHLKRLAEMGGVPLEELLITSQPVVHL